MSQTRPILFGAAVVVALSAYWLLRSDGEPNSDGSTATTSVDAVEDDLPQDRPASQPARRDRSRSPRGRDLPRRDFERADRAGRGEEAERSGDVADENGTSADDVAEGEALRDEQAQKLAELEARIAQLEKRAGELEAAGDIPGHDEINDKLERLNQQRDRLEQELERGEEQR